MKVLCINLPSRFDRRLQAEDEFKRVGLSVEFIDAISGENRPMAFNQSVIKAMKMADGQDLLLFEDDVVFDFDGGIIDIAGLPNDFLTLHLGANIVGTDIKEWKMPTSYNSSYAKLHNCWQSHATLYSLECVNYILSNFRDDILTAENPIFDEWLRVNVFPKDRSYIMKPMIAYQRDSFSDIWQHQAQYKHYHIEGNKYLAGL
jgi:GR25 family glycosyltransferase involved in LPS biosynthesis